jgi:hypothetical protein
MESSLSNDAVLPALSWLAPGMAACVPDFLVISAPKTGSTWLAANLRCHPEIFVPAIKEVKYFSSYHEYLDLKWYLGYFREGVGRLKGEASPSYAMLPLRTIRMIRSLMPRVKLIFLMRDPVARAWSHARHNYRYREANFRGYTGDIDSVSDATWGANFNHPWPLLAGDYLGQLRRWLAVFPREQLYVDFYERLSSDPVGLLRDIARFLGARVDVDWSAFPTRETILPGEPKPLPAGLRTELRLLLEARTRELAAFLREHFGLQVGDRWPETLGPELQGVNGGGGTALERLPADDSGAAVFARASDDTFLATLLQTEVDSAEPRLIEEGYLGHNLVFYRRRFLALPQTLGAIDRQRLNEIAAGARGTQGTLVGDSLDDIKEQVEQHILGELRAAQDVLAVKQQELTALRQELATVRQTLETERREAQERQEELAAQLAACEEFMARVRRSLPFRLRRAITSLFARWTRKRK